MSNTTVVAVPFDLSGSEGLNFGNAILYQTYWNTFDRIQVYNARVSTMRATTGDPNLTYYKYTGSDERTQFIWGRMLHIRRYPNSNWAEVEQN